MPGAAEPRYAAYIRLLSKHSSTVHHAQNEGSFHMQHIPTTMASGVQVSQTPFLSAQ